MMGPVIGHLGTRASALLDGQLPQAEADRLWAHVHGCHLCRDLVEREGWIKTQLSGLCSPPTAPDHLKGALMGACAASASPWELAARPPALPARPARRGVTVAASVGGAAGMAVLGVLALGAAPADAPTIDRRVPAANLTPPAGGSTLLPAGRQTRP
jgi:hypothetical protein